MISFCSMHENDYPGYLEYFIPDYANEIQANYRLSQSVARVRAEQEIAELLFEGVNTPGHTLLNLMADSEHTNKHIGYLW